MSQARRLCPLTPSVPLPPPSETGRAAVQAFLSNLTAEDIRCLADRHKIDINLLMSPIAASTASGIKAEAPLHLAPLTSKDIARNDLHIEAIAPHLGDFETFIPSLKKKEPAALIRTLVQRFKEESTTENGQLLQAAMNRYTSTGTVEGHLKEAIEEARAIFHKGHEPDARLGGTDDIWYQAWVDASYRGASIFQDMGPGWLYYGYRYVGDAMNDKISSLKAGCSRNEVGGYVLLFENASFEGKFQKYTLTGPSQTEDDVSYVGGDFNDITSSTLIVRRFPNETSPVSIGSLIPQQSILDIINSQTDVRSHGNTAFTWDMWPTGPTSGDDWHPNDTNKTFIYINVPIQVNTHQWFFGGWYDAQVRYWIYLYVDGNGKLQGYVDWWGYWVQGGLYTGPVASGLSSKIPGTIGQVNNLIGQALALANIAGAPYNFTYYLPGTGTATGNTWDGVSVVGVKRS